MTDTLEDLLATSLRGAADTLDATPDVDAALVTGRRQLRHRRIAIGAACLAGLIIVPSVAFASRSMTPSNPSMASPSPMASSPSSVTITKKGLDTNSYARPHSAKTDPTAVTVTWTPRTSTLGHVNASFTLANGTQKTVERDCSVPCYVPGPSGLGYGMTFVPSNATDDFYQSRPVDAEILSASAGEAEIPGTGLRVGIERYSPIRATPTFADTFYITSDGVFGPDNVPITSHVFTRQQGAMLFASSEYDIFGDSVAGHMSYTSLSATPVGSFRVGMETVDEDNMMSRYRAFGLVPADATRVEVARPDGSTGYIIEVDRSQVVAGGHLFMASWVASEYADTWATVALVYTDGSGKRITKQP